MKSVQQNKETILEQAIQDFIDAELRGENPDIDEYIKQFPDIENQIRQRIQNLQQINGLFDCLIDSDDDNGSDIPIVHDLVGQKLGDFEILEILGQGGMGVVFLARQISLDRKVALKVITDITGTRRRTLDRFKREAKILAKISHPNIVPIYEVGEQGPYSYYAMEYIQGTSLDGILDCIRDSSQNEKAINIMSACLKGMNTHVKQNEKLAIGIEIDKDYIVKISRIIKDIALALEHAHNNGILHRDIKPSNILIDRTGIPKLVDFGLGKAQTQKSITVTGELFGTPNYMAPEQIKAPKSVNCRSDLYSLAATYYECLTLHPPFDGDTVNETLTKVISQEVVAPKKYCPRLSNDFNTVLLHALEKSPQDRYQTVTDFAADIENILNFKPIEAKRPSITRRVCKTFRRSPLKVAFAFLIIFTVSSIYVIYSTYLKQSEKQRDIKVHKLLEGGDLLLCQAALNTLPWPTIGVETITSRASEKYNKVLQIDENNWWALVQNGLAQLVHGDRAEQALEYFIRAERIKPDFVAIEYLKSKALEQLEKGDAKKVELDGLSSVTYKEAYILGMLALQKEAPPSNEQKALSLFSICIEKEPDFYPAHLAKAFVQLGRKENLSECLTLVEMKPNCAFSHILVGYNLDIHLGKPGESIKWHEKAIQLQPWNPKTLYQTALIYGKIGSHKKEKAHLLQACQVDTSSWSYLNLAQFYLRNKNYPEALNSCDKALEKRYDCYLKKALLDVKIECLNELGTVDEINECLKQKEQCLRTLVVTPQWNQQPVFHNELLRFLYANDRKAEARQFFEETTKNRPELRLALGRELAQAYESDGQNIEALKLDKILLSEIIGGTLDRRYASSYDIEEIVNRAAMSAFHSYDKDGKDLGSKLWRLVLKIFPHDSVLWFRYGFFLSTYLKDYDAAIEAYREALRYEKDESERFSVSLWLGTTLYRAGRFDDAEKELKALQYKLDNLEVMAGRERLFPGDSSNTVSTEVTSSVYVRLSDVYLAQKQNNKALVVLGKGLQRLPNNLELHRVLADTCTIAGDNATAIELYLKYFELLPVDLTQGIDNLIERELLGETATKLTKLLEEEGRVDEAHEFWLREKQLNRKLR